MQRNSRIAEQTVRERRNQLGYLEALLQAEVDEREQRPIERRIREASLGEVRYVPLAEVGANSCSKSRPNAPRRPP